MKKSPTRSMSTRSISTRSRVIFGNARTRKQARCFILIAALLATIIVGLVILFCGTHRLTTTYTRDNTQDRIVPTAQPDIGQDDVPLSVNITETRCYANGPATEIKYHTNNPKSNSESPKGNPDNPTTPATAEAEIVPLANMSANADANSSTTVMPGTNISANVSANVIAATVPSTNISAKVSTAATIPGTDVPAPIELNSFGLQPEDYVLIEEPPVAIEATRAYTDEDLMLLAKVIFGEAGSDWLSDRHQLLVGNVVLNRVASPEFPNSISEVVYQRTYIPSLGRYIYQYSCISSPYWKREPSERAIRNARRLLEGERFCPPSVVFQANFPQGSGTFEVIPDRYLPTTYFCYSSYPKLYTSST